MATLKPFHMKGGADVNNAKIINVATPINDNDAANKAYVNSVVNGKTYSYTTDQVSEGTNNLYFSATRARTSLSFVAGAAAYNSSTGVFTLPTKTSHLTNDSGFLTVESDTLASVTGRGNTTKEIVDAFEKATGVKVNWKFGPRREGDIEKIWGDCSKANNVLGWKAEASLEDVMASAWKWQLKLREDGIM